MQNLHTYAIIHTPINPLELPLGIANQVQIVSSDRLSAIVEPEVNLEALRSNDQQLMQAVLSHDRVVCEVFYQTTVLPLRFGIAFATVEKLLTHLESHSQQYLKKLEKLNGLAEYTLKFTQLAPPEPALPTDVKGREYFLAKKQRYQLQQDFQTAQTQELQQVVTAIAQTDNSAIISQPEGQEPRIYLLINRDNEPVLFERVQDWQQASLCWHLHLSAALPPYHFIDASEN